MCHPVENTGILKRITVFIVITLVFCTLSVVSGFDERKEPAPEGRNVSSMGPVVTDTTQTSTIIRFMSPESCIPAIQYANESWFSVTRTYDHVETTASNSTYPAILLRGLDPGTRYHYTLHGCGINEKDRSFSTLTEKGSCTFIVYGDTREQVPLYTQEERHKLVAGMIARETGISFVVNTGDLVADSNDNAEWGRFFHATDELRSVTTYIAVPGNHDTNRSLFSGLFGFERPGSFNCGDVQILLLDSTDLASMTMEEQAEWIVSANRSGAAIRVAVLHHPAYSSDEKHYGGWQDVRAELVPAFQKSGVLLAFSSHVHAFEQVERDGITYITEARGGAPAYPLNVTRIPGSLRAYENTLGYSRVTVDRDSGWITVDVLRVADVSGDLRRVTRVYPDGQADARIRIPLRKSSFRFMDISDILASLQQVKYHPG